VKTVPIEVQTFPAKGATILTHELTTNGILYADVALDYSKVLPEDIEILSLFSRMVLETGTADLDEAELQRRIGSETGGISTSFFSEAKAPATPGTTADMDDPILYFIFRGKATKERAAELFELMSTALTTCRLDNQKRAVELLKESKIRRESSVVTSGHSYASTRLAAQHSLLGLLNEKMGGITAVQAAGRLLTEAESDWPKFQARLERVRAAIAQQGDVVINLTGSADVLAAAAGPTDKFINDLAPASASTNSLVASFDRSQLIPAVNEGFSMASQVNYVAKSCPIISPNEKVKSSFSVASRYLSTGYLWDNVRVIGGAYGGFSRFSTDSGRVTFLSYRDPGAANTLEIYDKAADAMTEAELTDEDILQAVIGAVGDMDSPQMPDMRGFSSMVRYLTGTTDQERQRRRDEILSSTTADFRSFANKLQGMKDDGSTVIFGSQAALEAANSALPERKRLVISPAVSAGEP
jgi:Zn-dependent M16 (insulinase) family peptidase